GNSATTTTYYGIQLINGAPSIVARNTTARVNTSQTLLTGQRYHIAGVFNSNTSRTLYLNGVPMVTATTTATFASTNQQVRIGRYVGSTTNYFDGYIDDSRIYARSLSSEEILSLYKQRETTTVVPTATIIYTPASLTGGNVIATLTGYSEEITISNNGGNNSYVFTGNGEFTFIYQDSDGNIGSTIAAVDWIDKTPPTFIGVISGYIYPGNVTITFADDNLSGALLNGLPYLSGTVISGQNSYEFIVEDTLGNRTGARFEINTNPPPIASIQYTPTSDNITTGTVVATLTGFNTTGIIVTNNAGSLFYTFTGNGDFTFDLLSLGGKTGSVTASVDWIKNRLHYSTTGWLENQGIDNGSIAGDIIVTLGTGSFSPVVANYIQIDMLPLGLTGHYTLSGTNTVIISLSGNALEHMAENSKENLNIRFLTGAFIDWNPDEVLDSTKTGLSLQFYDPPGFISGQQLRINGGLSGGKFYDWSSNHRATTGYGSISNSSRSGETVIGSFNGSTQYITVGTYTLPNYSISARFNSSVIDANRRTIVGSEGVDGFEISKSTANKIVIYYNTQLTSLTTLEANKRYHVVVVKDAVGTKLYINGVLEASNTYTAGLTNLPLSIGRWTTSQYRNGLIDEVKIYDSPITQI
ncbi:MAG TPA: hypothetical protein PKC87_05420, partial [Candidatus Absconditabacterales bacterium]|nr:hypothetical protein [Candidatus Absconditabacterales bacterium]